MHRLNLQAAQTRRDEIELDIVLLGAKFGHGIILDPHLQLVGRFLGSGESGAGESEPARAKKETAAIE